MKFILTITIAYIGYNVALYASPELKVLALVFVIVGASIFGPKKTSKTTL